MWIFEYESEYMNTWIYEYMNIWIYMGHMKSMLIDSLVGKLRISGMQEIMNIVYVNDQMRVHRKGPTSFQPPRPCLTWAPPHPWHSPLTTPLRPLSKSSCPMKTDMPNSHWKSTRQGSTCSRRYRKSIGYNWNSRPRSTCCCSRVSIRHDWLSRRTSCRFKRSSSPSRYMSLPLARVSTTVALKKYDGPTNGYIYAYDRKIRRFTTTVAEPPVHSRIMYTRL